MLRTSIPLWNAFYFVRVHAFLLCRPSPAGACIDPPNQCWLVCELLPGGTLATWLYGPSGSRRPPDRSLQERLRMALDVARGMQVRVRRHWAVVRAVAQRVPAL